MERFILLISIFIVLSSLQSGSALSAQTHDFPCDAQANPVDGWISMTQSKVLSGNFEGVSPWETNLAAVNIQDFGVAGADSSVFYKLEVNENSRYITLEFMGGTATEVAAALFSLSNPCPVDLTFGEALYQDSDGATLLIEELDTEGFVRFDLCGFSPSDLSNLYLWLATPEEGVGNFTIEVTQGIPSENDNCGDAISFLVEEPEFEECYEGTNSWGCSETLIGAVEPCIAPLEEAGYATFWHEVSLETGIDFLEIDIEHSSGGELILSAIEFAGTACISSITELACQESSTGIIEDVGVPRPGNTAGQLYVLVSTPIENAGDYSLCITGGDSSCLNTLELERCLCETDPLCGLESPGTYCLQLESYQTPWAIFPGCPGDVLNNPSWFSFVAGQDSISLLISPNMCIPMGGANGIQFAIYSSGETDFPPDPECMECNPSLQSLTPVVTQCGCVTSPITASWTPEPGQRYFVVIDGCAGSFCEVDLEVLEGGGPPTVSPLELEDFEEIQIEEFNEVDIFCQGATGVSIDIVPPSGSNMLEYQVLPGGEVKTVRVDGSIGVFPLPIPDSIFIDEGAFEVCAVAFNQCGSSSGEICKEYSVMEIPDQFDDTLVLCKDETVIWEGIEVPGPDQEPGTTRTYETQKFTESFDCAYSAFIDVRVLDEAQSSLTIDFDQDVDSLIVSFFNLTDFADSLMWSFGDGTISSEQNPIHTYEEAGVFTVSLTAMNQCDTVTMERRIGVGGFPVADFEVSGPTRGCAPLEVQFENNSTGDIETIQWIFDGGSPAISSQQNPLVRYTSQGQYTATLIVENAVGQSEISIDRLVEVNTFPDAEISFEQVNDYTYDFSSELSPALNVDIRWEFGDGNTIVAPNPRHTYAEIGEYEVLFIWSNECGQDTLTEQIEITTSAPAFREPSAIQLFPNPAREFVILEGVPIGALVRMTDTKGRITYSAIHSGILRHRIALSSFRSGVYYILIEYKGDIQVKKLLVE